MLQKTIHVDPSNILGAVKPLNGVGGGPVTYHFNFNAIKEFREARIPYGRTHDIEYPFGAGEYVDIHNLFRDFDKDENDPANYNFALTDEYLKAMVEAGTEPFFRLGCTIEHQPVKLYVHPPKDFAKWGRICSRIIAHYNEGWANGFHMGITYWEIWNEPEGVSKCCFSGTEEQMLDLYCAAAKIIKKDHPDVKVGGCGLIIPTRPFAEKLCKRCSEENIPFDFMSWHNYFGTPASPVKLANFAQELLDKYGLTNTESIFDEWNYICSWGDDFPKSIALHKTPFGGAFVAAVMAALQRTSVSCAMYYDAQVLPGWEWNGVFSAGPQTTFTKQRGVICEAPYYALKAWGALTEAGTEVSALCEDENVYLCAAKSEDEVLLLVSYYNDDATLNQNPPETAEFTLDIPGVNLSDAVVYPVIDNDRLFVSEPLKDGKLTLPGNTFAFIRAKRTK